MQKTTRQCSRCRKMLTPQNASPNVIRKGGYCRPCSADYQRKYKTGVCGVCGGKTSAAWVLICAGCRAKGRRQVKKQPRPYRPLNAKHPHIDTEFGPVYIRPSDGRPGGKAWEAIRATVLARGVCELCGEPMDLGLKWNHPDAPTVDHITPLVMGGDAVALSNLRAAHRRCNSQQGTQLTNPETVKVLRLALVMASARL